MIARKLVIIESPYAAPTTEGLQANITYARRCMRNSIMEYKETPFASHLLYTQPGILDDTNPNERALGIMCGFEWGNKATLHAFYTDRGWSPGMLAALTMLKVNNLPYEFRAIFTKGSNPDGTPL